MEKMQLVLGIAALTLIGIEEYLHFGGAVIYKRPVLKPLVSPFPFFVSPSAPFAAAKD
jgi:hypothetical protein